MDATWEEYASRVPDHATDEEYLASHILELRDHGRIPKIPWLDRFTLPMLERIRTGTGRPGDLPISIPGLGDSSDSRKSADTAGTTTPPADRATAAAASGSGEQNTPGSPSESKADPEATARMKSAIAGLKPRPPFVHIELPKLPYPVVFYDAPARRQDDVRHNGVGTDVREFQVADVAEAVEVMADALKRDAAVPPALLPGTHGVPRASPMKPLRGLNRRRGGIRASARSRRR